MPVALLPITIIRRYLYLKNIIYKQSFSNIFFVLYSLILQKKKKEFLKEFKKFNLKYYLLHKKSYRLASKSQ